MVPKKMQGGCHRPQCHARSGKHGRPKFFLLAVGGRRLQDPQTLHVRPTVRLRSKSYSVGQMEGKNMQMAFSQAAACTAANQAVSVIR